MCASVSIPIASPLIIQILFLESSFANFLAYFLPYSVEFLDPTIATILSQFNRDIFPLQYICTGYSFIFNNLVGYSS